MRIRIPIAATAALLLLPLGATASERILSSGKLDATNSFDFSCSLVNKSGDDITVTLRLKNPDGSTYTNPSTFQPATLDDVTVGDGEAIMVVAPAGFVGVTSVYCWAEVPEEATVFGSHLVRDAQDRSTAATPLKEDVNQAANIIIDKLQEIHEKIDAGPECIRQNSSADQTQAEFTFADGNTPTLVCPDGMIAFDCGYNFQREEYRMKQVRIDEGGSCRYTSLQNGGANGRVDFFLLCCPGSVPEDD